MISFYFLDILIVTFVIETESDKEPGQIAALTFLYQLVEGAASRSYGLNVARMADLPTEILRYASQKSKEMEEKVLSKRFVL